MHHRSVATRRACGLGLFCALSALAAAPTGCGRGTLFSYSFWNPLGLPLDPSAKPVRIGVHYEAGGFFDIRKWGEKPPWYDLRIALQNELKRPVWFENYKPFQIQFHLQETGQLDFALLSANDYMELESAADEGMLAGEGSVGEAVDDDRSGDADAGDESMWDDDMPVGGDIGDVIAISVGNVRQGVIVARASSDIRTIEDLKNKPFAFGPRNDPVLHNAAAELLTEHDVTVAGHAILPGVNEHHISSAEAAKDIAYSLLTKAGVIEAREFDAYPDTGGRLLTATFSKDQFRELGRTKKVRVDNVGEGPFVASRLADRELVDRVRGFLLDAEREQPAAILRLGFAGFRSGTDDPQAEIRRMATGITP